MRPAGARFPSAAYRRHERHRPDRPAGGGRPARPRLPGRQPDRRRLRRRRRRVAREGLRRLELAPPDVAVVDVGLPDGSGLELWPACARRAGAGTRVDPALPMLVLSGRGRRAGPRARVRPRGGRLRGQAVLLPRAAPAAGGAAAPLRRPRARRAAAGRRAGDRPREPRRARGGRARVLSQKEFALLLALAAQPTRVFTKEELLRDGLGLPLDGPHAHPGLARVPAAAQARGRGRDLRRQRVGRRLPARRRASGRGGGVAA